MFATRRKSPVCKPAIVITQMPNELPVLNEPKERKATWTKTEFPSIVVVIWFVACWFIGSSRAGLELDEFFELAYPNAEHFERINDLRFRVVGVDGSIVGYVATRDGKRLRRSTKDGRCRDAPR